MAVAGSRHKLMHLLNIEQSGALYDSAEAVDLDIPAGDIICLSSADTDIALLAYAARRYADAVPIDGVLPSASPSNRPTIRLANYLSLSHPYSVDLFAEKTCSTAKIIVIRLLGGSSYWRYGVERFHQLASIGGMKLILVSGDGKPDPELDQLSSVGPDVCKAIAGYFEAGGALNADRLIGFLADLLSNDEQDAMSARLPHHPVMQAGLYLPHSDSAAVPSLDEVLAKAGDTTRPVAAIVFYRALYQSGDTAPIDSLAASLAAQNMTVICLFVASLKQPESAEICADILSRAGTDIILNTTSFAVSDPDTATIAQESNDRSPGPFGACDAPVFQVVLSSMRSDDWQASMAGLSARDLAMHVALPELDGRVLTRALAFKKTPERDVLTGAMLTGYDVCGDRADYIASLSANWARLRRTPSAKTSVALILANYPNKDGRIANGVGLDTPESALHILQCLRADGYHIEGLPDSSAQLIEALKAGPTNAGWQGRIATHHLSLSDYQQRFTALPGEVREAILARWGAPEKDPMSDGSRFYLPLLSYGNAFVGVQPARGYQIDPKASYHSPDLVPPHHYLAFYFYLREQVNIDAVMHVGKHGNLEWLPGRALALSQACLPEAILGPIPHLYPFIVNDPGEGAQAKRRTSAVILDHLTPPLMQAGALESLAALESLMDEYYEAAGMDTTRAKALMDDILAQSDQMGLTKDCAFESTDSPAEKLMKLDNYLCDLKELQIRDGLHIYGKLPDAGQTDALIAAIMRSPRGLSDAADASLVRVLADELSLLHGFDPLAAEKAEPWEGARPDILRDISDNVWRTNGDTVERLDALALQLVSAPENAPQIGSQLTALLAGTGAAVRRGITLSAEMEKRSLLRALDGKYIPAGPSGAPTRGRPEILPTGRNFYSLDSRALPTPSAWRIGWASATALLERFVMDEGCWPRSLALSAWGTANMRTGGDDIAQALALLGVQPAWDSHSRRVTGFDVMPLSVLDRPRVDVTLRCSGFFRDAFPAQIQLLDRAMRAVAGLDEPEDMNPLAASVTATKNALMAKGMSEAEAENRASIRIFSAKPGAYGAGLQTLIDEGVWEKTSDFADAFMAWSSYGYGEGREGIQAGDMLTERLGATDGVIHNQDNREHDILDSDDYYQFIGGLSASIETIKGHAVPIYHNDHSNTERPIIRALSEELGRVVRGRASNPKWIEGVMRHGYKGAFEISATLDYLFAFAATTGQVEEHHFSQLYEAWVDDKTVSAFLQKANPDAWQDILARFSDAIDRGLWHPRRNDIPDRLGR